MQRGKVAYVGPNWQSELPADVKRIDCPTPWILIQPLRMASSAQYARRLSEKGRFGAGNQLLSLSAPDDFVPA